MATEIKLPQLGENLTGGDVLDVKVKAGDTISQGQTLLEVEAEKSTVEVPSPVAGRISKMLVKKGDTIEVGQTLCLLEATDGAQSQKTVEAPVREAPAAENKPDSAKTPSRKQESERSGQPKDKRAQPDGVGKPAASPAEQDRTRERAEGAAPPEARPTAKPATDGQRAPPAPPSAARPGQATVPAGPATRRLARELGVDLRQVHGSAPGGRVTQEDIKAYVHQLTSAPTVRGAGAAVPPLPDFERWGPVDRQPLDGIRRKIAEQMSLAWSTVPHVTQHDQADVTDLDAFRRQQHGEPKLTVTAFALKAAVIALEQFPQFNASLDLAAGQLVRKRYYHLGIAVDTDRGLLVPVLRDVDRKTIYELAQELAAVAERARQKKLQVDEMRGGTFTITNLGGIGGTGFTPIVNYPEVAILGLSRSRLQPVVRESQIVARLLLPLSLSYDHRVIDGADAARFTRRIADLLENPLQMLLHA
ncbi:MAG TPA: dihydrolipoamide acetyltransferase family protein [Gemmataceae bacterium]|nr:dihydrolipoamide acetyltransferase family protein [Gemmataceae bacterium]